MNEFPTLYWIKITDITINGLPVEKAREKLYQELFKKGDLGVAKLFREFRNKVHSLKNPDHLPPSSNPKNPAS